MTDDGSDRSALRRRMRADRSRRTVEERDDAARSLAHTAFGWDGFAAARRVAGYVAVDGELDPAPLLDALASRGVGIHLPVLTDGVLRFGPSGGGTTLRANRFGVPEPVDVELVDGAALDVVLVPLVAVDRAGNRLGFGAGWYDRTFARLGAGPKPHAPVLVGVAYDEQVVERVPSEEWDVPLDAVLTPTRRIGTALPQR